MARVIRKLCWFRTDNDELAGQEPLRGIALRDLRRAFGNPPDDPRLCLCYEVTDRQRDLVQKHVKHRIEASRYAYFVEAETAAAQVSARQRRAIISEAVAAADAHVAAPVRQRRAG